MQRIQKWTIPHTLTCIIISSDGLLNLPEDGELSDITTIEGKYSHNNVRHQITIDFVYTYEGYLHSAAQLHELNKHVKENVKKVVQDILEENKGECYYKQTTNKNIPWSTRGKIPVSEFTTQHFVLLAFHIIALVTLTLTGDF